MDYLIKLISKTFLPQYKRKKWSLFFNIFPKNHKICKKNFYLNSFKNHQSKNLVKIIDFRFRAVRGKVIIKNTFKMEIYLTLSTKLKMISNIYHNKSRKMQKILKLTLKKFQKVHFQIGTR